MRIFKQNLCFATQPSAVDFIQITHGCFAGFGVSGQLHQRLGNAVMNTGE